MSIHHIGTLGLPYFFFQAAVDRLAQDIAFAMLGTCDRDGIKVIPPRADLNKCRTAALLALSWALDNAKIGVLHPGQDPGHGLLPKS